MDLPNQYAWLSASVELNESHPLMVAEAIRLFGTHEGDGKTNNPVIMGWVNEISAMPGKSNVKGFTNDHLEAWCGLMAAHCAHVAGYDFPDHPLWALNWQGFGEKSPLPSLGDVLVYVREDAKLGLCGHVGTYVAENETAFATLGGNEHDQVNIVLIEKSRLRSCRRPPYKVPPANVTPMHLGIDGGLSTNEA